MRTLVFRKPNDMEYLFIEQAERALKEKTEIELYGKLYRVFSVDKELGKENDYDPDWAWVAVVRIDLDEVK